MWPRGKCWSAQGRVDEDEDCVQVQAGPGAREGVPLLSLPHWCLRTELAHTLGADREANQDLVSKQKDEVKEGAQRGENGGGPCYVSLLPISQLNAGDIHEVAQWWGKQYPVIQVPTIDDATLVQN